MDCLRKSAICSRLEKHINNLIRERMNIKNSILNYMRYKQIYWYGHVQRMDKKRLPRKIVRKMTERLEQHI
jgi:hypothetical protein